MKFSQYLLENDSNQIKMGFENLRTKISSMFASLKKAAINTWGQNNGNERMRNIIVSDLEKIISKLKVKNEAIIHSIYNLINEADGITANLKPTADNSKTGRKVFDIGDVLKSIEDKIMQDVAELERSVLVGKIDTLDKKVSGIDKKLNNPAKPLRSNQEDTAYNAIDMLSALSVHGANKNMKLIHPFSGKTIDISTLKSPQGINSIISLAHQDSNFKMKYDGGEHDFNIGDIQNVDNMTNMFYTNNNIDPNHLPNQWKTKPMLSARNKPAIKLR